MATWPIDKLLARLDHPVDKLDEALFRESLAAFGYSPSLADFLAPLYHQANGGTLYDGAIRIIPFEGSEEEKIPGLLDWNDPDAEWREVAPGKSRQAFFFVANAFGDLLGVPLGEDREILRDRVGVLWVEKFKYEESSLGWSEILEKILDNDANMATYLGRLKESEWATKRLGKPLPSQCFSWDLPPALGGPETIDNLKITDMYVSVSFTLQVLSQSAR